MGHAQELRLLLDPLRIAPAPRLAVRGEPFRASRAAPKRQEHQRQGLRLVLPVGDRGYQELEIWLKENGECRKRTSIGVAFVLLRGERGWK